MGRSDFVRQPLETVTARYERIAPWYRYGEWTVGLAPGFRRRALRRLRLEPGQTVLEVGCGTGRNLRLLRQGVGPSGLVIGVDATAGMLAQAERVVARHGWSNVRLIRQDASQLELEEQVDVVYFSLSYSVMPERQPVLDRVWSTLRPGGRLVVMDAGLSDNRLGRLLGPYAEAVATIFPGDPYSRPWVDLQRLTPVVETERFQFGTYFICTAIKARGQAQEHATSS